METRPKLTTESGAPVADNQHSQTAGPGGPVLLQDHASDRETGALQPRAHPGAHRARPRLRRLRALRGHEGRDALHPGTLPVRDRQDRPRSSCASRTVAGGRGSADAVRDPRGFAIKFYTEDGNYDLDRQRHADLLHPRPAQVPRLHPLPEARPAHQPPGAGQRLGLLLALARGDAHVHLAVRRPRHPGQLPPHERLRLAHLPVGQRRR